MAENNKKNGYTPGYNGNLFDELPDFDSLQSMPQKRAEAITPRPESAAEPMKKSDSSAEKAQKETAAVGTKKGIFGFLCAIIVIAIVSSSALAVFNITKGFSSNGTGSDTDDDFSNIYSQMIASYNSNISYPAGIPQMLTRLYAQNQDIVGWLYIPGTNINTPIVQHTDNDFYLTHNYYGSYTKYGCVYADYKCQRKTLSKSTVIYGHDMSCGTAFYDLNRYDDIEWYKKNPVITYHTLYGSYTFLIYTTILTTVESKDDGGYVFNFIEPNMSNSSFSGFIEQVNQRALYTTGVGLNTSDRVITLSTCNYNYTNAIGKTVNTRLVVIGRLLRSGESADVDTSKAKENPNYRRPQVWYDYKGKTNPYASSRSWKPSTK